MGEWMYRSTYPWPRHWSASCLSPKKKRSPRTHWIRGWVGPTTGLDDVEMRKILPLLGLELQSLGRPVHSQSLYRLRYPGYEENQQLMLILFLGCYSVCCRSLSGTSASIFRVEVCRLVSFCMFWKATGKGVGLYGVGVRACLSPYPHWFSKQNAIYPHTLTNPHISSEKSDKYPATTWCSNQRKNLPAITDHGGSL
jgi:hypothetical protein